MNGARMGRKTRGCGCRTTGDEVIDRRIVLLVVLAAAFCLAGSGHADTLMPAGDSITQGVGSTSGLGFRHSLYTSLNTIGTYDFVGPTGVPPDEGDFYAGARIADFLAGGAHDVSPTITTYAPDLVAVHLGTNDVYMQPGPFGPWSFDHATPNPNASGRLGALVNYILAAGRRVIVSRIIPITGREADVEDFNREVVRCVLDYRNGAVTGSAAPVTLADHYLRFTNNPNAANDWMFDQIHPNDTGYDEMEAVYFEAVREAMTDVVPPDPVADLAVGTVNGESVLLIWTNTGDDLSTGDPRYADCRFSQAPITTANFKTLGQGGDYRFVGRAGEVSGTRIDGLTPATAYYFAMKLTDEVPNLSAMSNPVVTATTVSSNVYEDSFTRAMPAPGPDWIATDYIANGSELERTAAGFGAAVFTAVSNPATAEITWGAAADAPGINQAGVACRLEGVDPTTADGYIVYRNTAGDQTLALREVVDGVPGALLDTAPATRPAPQAGDRFAVTLSSDSDGHRFAVYVNGALDAVLVDPLRRRGNGDYWCGVVCDGSFNNNVAAWRVEALSTNLPPLAFDLLAPANSTLLQNLNPPLDWQSTTDPNGDAVTYDVFLSPDPTFPPGATLRADNLAASNYATGVPLAANTTYYWRVRAQDPIGATTYSSATWTLVTANLQQVRDDFERPALGPDWIADPSYSLVNGELDGSAPGFSDLAVYAAVENPVAVEWRWSETASPPGIGFGGCLLGLSAPATTASGYFVFRNTSGSQRWSVWEVVDGELGTTLNIDVAGANPIPGPGDLVRVVFVRDQAGHHFECYVNDRFDARLTDAQRRQGTAAVTYAGLLLGENAANNVEDFVVMGQNLNLPPAAFNLLQPTDQSIVYSLAPELRWEPAFDPNPGDQVTYTVRYDTDPGFGNPVSLSPTLGTAIVIRTPLISGQAYHWRVDAADPSGGEASSIQTWTFATAPVAVHLDDFNRPALGSEWAGDLATMRIVSNELRNIAPTTSFDLAIYTVRTNPNAAGFRWSPSANADGILRGSLALMLDGASGSASGYAVTIDPYLNRSKLAEIRDGAIVAQITNTNGEANPPAPGGSWRVLASSDPTGHHFDVYVGDDFHSRLTDPIKRQGNAGTLYAGVGLRGQAQNYVDDYALTFSLGPAPGPFALAAPAEADTGVTYQPTFAWHPAGPLGVAYVVYVGTDSSWAACDSLVALTDTTLVWPEPLASATDYVWRVRATDGQSSVLNSRGWYRFRTTIVSAVELASFTARGEVGAIVLSWTAERETGHLGYHVWRAAADEAYTRLTGPDPVTGESSYTFTDRSAAPGRTYRYRLEALSRSGESEFFGPVTGTALEVPVVLALHPNVPNPFNPATALTFDLPARAAVRLVVFDLSGRAVSEVTSGTYPAGRHTVIWDGRLGSGSPASSGIYFARLTVGDWATTRKLILMK